jgi:hypothetical protein
MDSHRAPDHRPQDRRDSGLQQSHSAARHCG